MLFYETYHPIKTVTDNGGVIICSNSQSPWGISILLVLYLVLVYCTAYENSLNPNNIQIFRSTLLRWSYSYSVSSISFDGGGLIYLMFEGIFKKRGDGVRWERAKEREIASVLARTPKLDKLATYMNIRAKKKRTN